MTHDENTAMERSYHPTGAELWFLLSLLDDRPAQLFWPVGESAENWPLVAVRLLDAGLAVRGAAGPAAGHREIRRPRRTGLSAHTGRGR